MSRYYYTGVSDQKLQYNKIKFKKKKKFSVLMVKYQIAQQVFKRNFDRFSIPCDHSSIIIIIIVIIITTTTTTSLYFSQKWNYNEIRKMIIMKRQNKHSCIILEPRGWKNR